MAHDTACNRIVLKRCLISLSQCILPRSHVDIHAVEVDKVEVRVELIVFSSQGANRISWYSSMFSCWIQTIQRTLTFTARSRKADVVNGNEYVRYTILNVQMHNYCTYRLHMYA